MEFIPLNPSTEQNADEARALCSGCLCRVLGYPLADVALFGLSSLTTA